MKFSTNELALFDYLHKKARSHQLKFFLVGGYVRDKVMGRASVDIDIAVQGDYKDLLKAFQDENTTSFDQYLSLHTHYKHFSLDFTCFRQETYDEWSHLPRVAPGTFIHDVLRRDFPINSLYYDLENRTLIDPLDGKGDIKKRIIRPNHQETLWLDPSRYYRMLYYAHQLGFSCQVKSNEDFLSWFQQKISLRRQVLLLLTFMKKKTGHDFFQQLLAEGYLASIGINSWPLESKSFEDSLKKVLLHNEDFLKLVRKFGFYGTIVKEIAGEDENNGSKDKN